MFFLFSSKCILRNLGSNEIQSRTSVELYNSVMELGMDLVENLITFLASVIGISIRCACVTRTAT